jgi:hydroxysqualene synthase
MPIRSEALASAYATCQRDVRAHSENFPVASVLLPRRMRPHVGAVYAFARAADDFADEGSRSAAERHALLDRWLTRVRSAFVSDAPGRTPAPGEPANTVEIFLALGATIRALELPLMPFEDLLSAFRQDITTTRYASWSELLDYCRRSANPVGRLVLRIAGCSDPTLDVASDALCTALQLTNFWQDVRSDFERGRIYLPHELLAKYELNENDLRRDTMSADWKRAIAEALIKTQHFYREGRAICDGVSGLQYHLRATWLGGRRILDKIANADFDVLARRPTLGMRDLPWFAWHLVSWR